MFPSESSVKDKSCSLTLFFRHLPNVGFFEMPSSAIYPALKSHAGTLFTICLMFYFTFPANSIYLGVNFLWWNSVRICLFIWSLVVLYEARIVLGKQFDWFLGFSTRYLEIVRSEGLEISQPALDPNSTDIHHRITIRSRGKKFHR